VALEVSMPGSDLEFYKLTYRGEIYFCPCSPTQWTLRLRTELGYGDGYGDTTACRSTSTFSPVVSARCAATR
jgi:outer membrane protein insertion porin family